MGKNTPPSGPSGAPETDAPEPDAPEPDAPEPETVEADAAAAGAATPPADTGLACLVMLSQFFEKPADRAQLAHEYAPGGTPVDEIELLRAARSLGFRAKAMDLDPGRAEHAPLPVIGQWRDEETEVETEDGGVETVMRPGGFFILAKAQTGPAKSGAGDKGAKDKGAKSKDAGANTDGGANAARARVLIQDPTDA